jgi:hypothetical protein
VLQFVDFNTNICGLDIFNLDEFVIIGDEYLNVVV